MGLHVAFGSIAGAVAVMEANDKKSLLCALFPALYGSRGVPELMRSFLPLRAAQLIGVKRVS